MAITKEQILGYLSLLAGQAGDREIAVFRAAIDRAYLEITNNPRRRWSYFARSRALVLQEPYSTGTVDWAAGALNLVGTGTSWGTDVVGQFITVGGGRQLYEIKSRDDGTNIALEDGSQYPLEDQSDQTYSIMFARPNLQPSADITVVDVLAASLDNHWKLVKRDWDDLWSRFFTNAGGRSRTGLPELFAFRMNDAGSPEMLVYPAPRARMSMQIRVYENRGAMQDGDATPIPYFPTQLENLLKASALRHAAELGISFMSSELSPESLYQRELAAAIKEDNARRPSHDFRPGRSEGHDGSVIYVRGR